MTEEKIIRNGTIKDLLNDIRGDLNLIKSYKDFREDKPYLLGWIEQIELMLGLKEVKE